MRTSIPNFNNNYITNSNNMQFYRRVATLVFPMALQYFMNALVSASDALMLVVYENLKQMHGDNVVIRLRCLMDSNLLLTKDYVHFTWPSLTNQVIWGFAFSMAFVLKMPVPVVYLCLNLDEFTKIPAEIWYYKKYTWLKNITR